MLMRLKKKRISLSDQHAMKPQQIISDVTTALRFAAEFMIELAATFT